MKEEPSIVKCYQCKKKDVVGGTKLFPFCSKECKKVWSKEHWGLMEKKRNKYKTIEDCQRRIAEMKRKIRRRT